MAVKAGPVEHEVILQTLNRASLGIFLPEERFSPTADAWAGVPIIFAKDHPEPESYDRNPEAELKRPEIQGRIVGRVKRASIDRIGHPKLMGILETEDPEVDALKADGKLSLSTMFRARHDGKRLTTNVRPHHVFLFEEKPGMTPGDRGSTFLHAQKEDVLDEVITKLRGLFGKEESFALPSLGFAVKEELKGAPPDISKEAKTMTDKEQDLKFAEITKELEAAKNALKVKETDVLAFADKVKALEAEKADLVKAVDGYKSADKEKAWLAFREHLPKGLVTKETEPETRTEYEKDPASLALKVLAFRAASPPDSGVSGADQQAAAKPESNTTVGKWDPNKKDWV